MINPNLSLQFPLVGDDIFESVKTVVEYRPDPAGMTSDIRRRTRRNAYMGSQLYCDDSGRGIGFPALGINGSDKMPTSAIDDYLNILEDRYANNDLEGSTTPQRFMISAWLSPHSTEIDQALVGEIIGESSPFDWALSNETHVSSLVIRGNTESGERCPVNEVWHALGMTSVLAAIKERPSRKSLYDSATIQVAQHALPFFWNRLNEIGMIPEQVEDHRGPALPGTGIMQENFRLDLRELTNQYLKNAASLGIVMKFD